jgi:hypothetical protein
VNCPTRAQPRIQTKGVPDQTDTGQSEHALGLVLVEFTRYGMEGSSSPAGSRLALSPVIHLRRPGALHLHALTGITQPEPWPVDRRLGLGPVPSLDKAMAPNNRRGWASPATVPESAV